MGVVGGGECGEQERVCRTGWGPKHIDGQGVRFVTKRRGGRKPEGRGTAWHERHKRVGAGKGQAGHKHGKRGTSGPG